MNEDVQKGKVEVAKTKSERDQESQLGALKSQQKKRQRKRDGPSVFYYEDENRLDLGYGMIQKFGRLDLSPPTEFDMLDATNKKLVDLSLIHI